MDPAHVRLCLQLHAVPGITETLLARMLLHCGSPQALAAGGPALWRELGLAPAAAQALARILRGGSHPIDIDAQQASLARVGAEVVPITAVGYPPLLRTIPDPPPLLYVRGDTGLLAQAQLAMVGSRRASPAGVRAAQDLAAQAVRAGLHITSGLARGIDGAAHRAALAAGGRSVAVMATGIDQVYPYRHRSLAADLVAAGCLVSEFPPGVAPLQHNFPRRNRIISGLCLGVVVVEAALPSGSLVTARAALEQGREVFALPWSIYHAGGAGCLHLIRDGAKMVESLQDVLEELGPMFSLQQDLLPLRREAPQETGGFTSSQQQLLRLIGYECITVDELARLGAVPVSRVMADVTFLEIRGAVVRCDGGYIRS